MFLRTKILWEKWLNKLQLNFPEHISLGALGDSFYEYLLKAWIQNGQTESEVRQMYDDAMQALIANIIVTSPSGLTYASDMKFDRLEHKMDHLACFAGKASANSTIINKLWSTWANIWI